MYRKHCHVLCAEFIVLTPCFEDISLYIAKLLIVLSLHIYFFVLVMQG